MKYICFSFDDARSDTWNVAMPIMDSCGFKATVNVVSDFVLKPLKYMFVNSPQPMTAEQLVEWQSWGGEIACHGCTHNNTPKDILRNIVDLGKMGVNTADIGFASPNSWLTEDNMDRSGIAELRRNGTLSYLRSGIVLRREKPIYIAFSILEKLTHSKELFYRLNKKCIISGDKFGLILPSVAIKSYTTENQVKYYINKMKDGDALILMFHSILNENKVADRKDYWYWQSTKFKNLCEWIKGNKYTDVILTKELIKSMEGYNGQQAEGAASWK